MITMRNLLASKKDASVLKKLRQLNVGVSNVTGAVLGSKWTIGSHEPTLEWVQWVRRNIRCIDERAKRFGWTSWLDNRLRLELDWTRHFGILQTGPMI